MATDNGAHQGTDGGYLAWSEGDEALWQAVIQRPGIDRDFALVGAVIEAVLAPEVWPLLVAVAHRREVAGG